MNYTTLNIENLAALWTLVAQASGDYQCIEGVKTAFINDSEWPNRIWSSTDNIPLSILTAKNTDYRNTRLSMFGAPISPASALAKELDLVSQQFGMHLQPTALDTEGHDELTFSKVTTEQHAQLWSATFASAFGYQIPASTVFKTSETIAFYNIYKQNTLVGTVFTFTTGTVLGIHSLGIPPQHRRKGYARKIMKSLIRQAVQNQQQLICLQASKMAKPLYQDLGFQEDFMMYNYRIK